MIKTRMMAVISAVGMMASAILGSPAASVFAKECITDSAEVSGSDYTDCVLLATALDKVFAGDIDLYTNGSCTREKTAALGSSPMTGSALYYVQSEVTGETVSGWQCYIYANAVYNKLFGEWIRHGDEEYFRSEVVLGGGYRNVSYELFAEAGVRCGAYMRTTACSDGSYNSSAAHSLIVLSYDETSVSYLDGNSDGNGLVRVNTCTWAEFNSANLSGHGRYTNHIIQPTEEYYRKLYEIPLYCLPTMSDSSGLTAGDVSGNGEADARDYLMLKRYVLGTLELTSWQKRAADLNGDGCIDACDYILLKNLLAEKYPQV